MQNICLLFSGRRGLDNPQTRNSVLRIPEVSRKLKEVQNWIDDFIKAEAQVDLYSYLQASEDVFNSKPNLKSLVTAVVQIGLFDRFVKYRNRPEFLIGRINGCSAMMVCAGLQSFQSFFETSDYYKENSLVTLYTQKEMKLSGVKLEEFGALQWNPEGFYQNMETEHKKAGKIIEQLSLSNILSQCVHIGPHYDFHVEEIQQEGVYGLASMSSIEMDPILNSFWKAAI